MKNENISNITNDYAYKLIEDTNFSKLTDEETTHLNNLFAGDYAISESLKECRFDYLRFELQGWVEIYNWIDPKHPIRNAEKFIEKCIRFADSLVKNACTNHGLKRTRLNLHSDILRKNYGSKGADKYTLMLQCLQHCGYIMRSRRYSNLKGKEFSKTCWATHKLILYSIDCGVLLSHYIDRELNEREVFALENLRKIHIDKDGIKKEISRLVRVVQMDKKRELAADGRGYEAIDEAKIDYHSLWVLYQLSEGNHYAKEDSYGRIHSLLTSLPKRYRHFITYGGERLCDVDLSTAQPALSIPMLKAAGEIEAEFEAAVCDGTLFDRLVKTGKDVFNYKYTRGMIKELFYSRFYFTDKLSSLDSEENNPVRKIMNVIFPKTLATVDKVREQMGHDKFATALQRKESDVMEDTLLFYEFKQTGVFIRFHDAILTTAEYKHDVRETLENWACQHLGIPVSTKIGQF